MQPARGYHRDLTELKHMPPRGCVLNETMIAVSPFNGTLRLAGTLELAGYNAAPIQARLNNLTHAASNYFNGLETNATTNIKEDWHGYRPCTPDGMPAIGAVTRANKETNLFIGTGHAMLGMTLGPASGKLIAQAVLGETQGTQNDGLYNSPLLSPMRFQ
jgi:D-amino-acid dehydrogenase